MSTSVDSTNFDPPLPPSTPTHLRNRLNDFDETNSFGIPGEDNPRRTKIDFEPTTWVVTCRHFVTVIARSQLEPSDASPQNDLKQTDGRHISIINQPAGRGLGEYPVCHSSTVYFWRSICHLTCIRTIMCLFGFRLYCSSFMALNPPKWAWICIFKPNRQYEQSR